MNRKQMEEAMLIAFEKQSHIDIERGWVDPTNYDNLFDYSTRWILGKTSPSFYYEEQYIGVDFECGIGSKVGSPTSERHITVYYKDFKKGQYHFERFSKKQLIDKAFERLNKVEVIEQLVLF